MPEPRSPAVDAAPPKPLRLGEPLAAALLVGATTLVHVWIAGRVELSPQEAYYWQYARHPALSYFDHPPLAAWTISLLERLLGHEERAVRAAAALDSAVFSAFLFGAARRLFGGRVALGALALALLTPLFSLGQLVITPDDPLLAAWAAAFYFTVRAVQEERGAWLLAAGAATGAAMLGKYTGALLGPAILGALLAHPAGRRLLRTAWPWCGALAAIGLFVPVLAWNASNGWVSFGFQFADRGHGLAAPSLARVGRFVGLQALLVTPAVLALSAWAAVRAARAPGWPLRACAAFSLPPFLVFAAVAPFTWVKGNWPAAAYPTALVAAVALLAPGIRGRRVLGASAALAAAVTLYLHAGTLFEALPFPARDVTTLGWRSLAARVAAERGAPGEHAPAVVGCGYKVASELAYYLPDHPQTLSGNAFGGEALEYAFWSDPRSLDGQDVIVVRDSRERGCPELALHCATIAPLEPLVVHRGPDVVSRFDLWRCRYSAAHRMP